MYKKGKDGKFQGSTKGGSAGGSKPSIFAARRYDPTPGGPHVTPKGFMRNSLKMGKLRVSAYATSGKGSRLARSISRQHLNAGFTRAVNNIGNPNYPRRK